MGIVEQAVDAAANFIGPFVDAGAKYEAQRNNGSDYEKAALVREAIEHLQAINTSDLAADPDAPYDASLAGVVYGLLDLATSLGILPFLSSGVAFSQRPRSVLIATFAIPSSQSGELLSETINPLLSILKQKEGAGLQPLVAQRSLPDIVSALAELSFSPQRSQQVHSTFQPAYEALLACTSTSRLLPILTTFLQQPLPVWLKSRMSRELAMVPTRVHGVRHVIEFLSLSYLTQNSQVPEDASGPQSRIPIPLEAVTQASRLLITPPSGTSQDEWIQTLEPQLYNLLDGHEGRELSRAAGQIIAGGILSKRVTGAPGTIGWRRFALPILQTICPGDHATSILRDSTHDRVLVQDHDMLLALQRLSVIVASYSHGGLIKRLVGPILLPLWAVYNYALSKRSINKAWSELSHDIVLRYMTTVCDPRQIDTITTDLFWNGKLSWTLGSGSKGGIEIRMRRMKEANTATEMESMFARISDLTTRVDLFVSLLEDAKASDDVIGLIFLQVTKRWLRPAQNKKEILLLDSDDDPLMALTDAKLSEALASRFKASFARSPQHVVELMSQILRRYVSDHRIQSDRQMRSRGPSRTTLGSIVASRIGPEERYKAGDTADEDLASFAMSILITLVSTPDFKQTPTTNALLAEVAGHLQYLIRPQLHASIPPVVVNSANNLLGLLRSTALAPGPGEPDVDPLIKHRTVLKAALQDMTSPEAPNRTWALDTLRKLIQDHDSFPVIDIPSTTYLVLSASLADPESYVHSASVPVLVTLAIRAPHPVIKILVDALFDVDERSLKLSKGKMTDAKEQELQEALDYRLRVGEVLNNILLVDSFWQNSTDMPVKYASIKRICEACLSLTSRRGQRHQTRSTRKTVSLQILQQQKEAEAAWGGPIPNILEADDEASTADRADYVALNKIVKGWENTGIEEDVRIRASAMSIYGTILEKRLEFVNQATVDAGLQMVLLVMTIETAESFFILRRAAVLVVMGLLRAVDAKLEVGEESAVGLATKQQEEVERVVRWSRDEDGDELVRDHAASVVEGLETLRMKKLYRIRDEGMRLGPDLGLEGGLRGLNVRPEADEGQYRRKMILEEIE